MQRFSVVRSTSFATLGVLILFSACVPILGIEEPQKGVHSECASFQCEDGVCQDVFEPFDTPCDVGGEISKTCNGAGACKLATRSGCKLDADCASGICTMGECKLGPQNACNSDDDCASHICLDICLQDLNQPCSSDDDCVTEACSGALCKFDDGGSCDFSDECISGSCANGICRFSDGSWCANDAECASGNCTDMACKLSQDKPCQNNADCGSNVCLGGFCVAQSCGGLLDACGPNSMESCCATILVDAGTYNRSNDAAAPANVDSFYLDRFEVTVSRFRRFVDVYPDSRPEIGDGTTWQIPGSGWNTDWDSLLPPTKADLVSKIKSCSGALTWTDTSTSNDTRPINCVDWYLAFAFCAWDGGRLPTEAEWNHAAAGGDEQRVYPWSNPSSDMTINGTYANYNCLGDMNTGCTPGDVFPVGSRSAKGDGHWGHADLAGSMLEWTLDVFMTDYPVPCTNCAQLSMGPMHVVRGGDWKQLASEATTSKRAQAPTEMGSETIGIRCARTVLKN